MCGESELFELAASPELIKSRAQLIALLRHVRSCAECASRFSAAIASRSLYIEPLRKRWEHLSKRQLRDLQERGYRIGSSKGEDAELFHLDLCPDCRKSYLALSESTRVRLSLKPVIVGLSVLVIALIVWQFPGRQHQPVYRDENAIDLKEPVDNATVTVYQSFSWEPVASAQAYDITISDVNTRAQVSSRRVALPSYVLGEDDAQHLVDGGVYEWSISSQSAEPLHSKARRFRFSAGRQLSYLDFPDGLRERTHEQVAHSDTAALINVEQRLRQYITRVGDKDSPDVAWAHGELAVIEYRRNEHGSGEEHFQAARKMWERIGIPDRLSYQRTLSNFGMSLQDQGRLTDALQLYKQGCQTPDVSKEKLFLLARSSCLLNLGTVYHDLGMSREAGEAYRQALFIDQALKLNGAIAEELNDLGNLETVDFANPQQGLRYLQDAERLQNEEMKKNGHPQASMPDTLDALAGAYAASGNADEALRYYQAVMRYDRQLHSLPTRVVETLNNVGNTHLQKNDLLNAHTAYKRALKIIVSSGSNVGPDHAWQTYDGLGQIALKQNDYVKAREQFNHSLSLIHVLTQQVSTLEFGARFSSLLTSPFYGNALLECRQGNASGALQAMEDARALPKQRALDLEQFGADAIRKGLGKNTAVLEYLTGSDYDPVLLAVLGPGGAHCYELGIRRDIDSAINTTLVPNTTSINQERGFGSLTKLLVPIDVQNDLRAHSLQRLLVSLDGSLTQISFSEINTCNGCKDLIGDTVTISNIPSIAWLINDQSQPRPTHVSEALIVGDPTVNPRGCVSVGPHSERMTFSVLPDAHKEISVASSYSGASAVILQNSDLNRHSFDHYWSRAGDFRVLHFATHAVSRGTVNNSFILFRCDGTLDALYGDEIMRNSVRTDLVVLSTCNSASGEALSAHGVDSLTTAFLSAGTRCVIASRSRVQDDDVASFVGSFYRSLARGSTPEQAVRIARQGMSATNGNNGVFESYGACDAVVRMHSQTLVSVILQNRWTIASAFFVLVAGSIVMLLTIRWRLRVRRLRSIV
jgi:tetratricopeptide (TPR) repeat protein